VGGLLGSGLKSTHALRRWCLLIVGDDVLGRRHQRIRQPSPDGERCWRFLSCCSSVGDGLGLHIPKGYIYFAMGFSVFVEMINLRVRSQAAPVRLREPYTEESETPVGRQAS
jgi:hypothetical protein